MEKEATLTRRTRTQDWARSPELQRKFPKLAAALAKDRKIRFARIKELGLPQADHVEAELPDFMDDPEKYFSQLETDKYYAAVNPKKENQVGFGQADLSREEILEEIKSKIPETRYLDYEIRLEEYKNLYGGTVVIGPENQVWIEFRKGRQTEIGEGSVTPEYTVENDKHTGVFRYSFEDEGLRKAVYDTLQAIPHTGEGRNAKYHPGYYEFAIFGEEDGNKYPIFFDCMEDPEFQVAWEK
jgi:hypothetical protein